MCHQSRSASKVIYVLINIWACEETSCSDRLDRWQAGLQKGEGLGAVAVLRIVTRNSMQRRVVSFPGWDWKDKAGHGRIAVLKSWEDSMRGCEAHLSGRI